MPSTIHHPPIPLIDLTAHHRPIREEIIQAISNTLDKNGFILGPEVERFEERIAAYSQTSAAIGVSSGTDALLVSLMALGIGPGDEVITTTYSFFATAGVIVRLGAKPVFVDIDPVTYNINPQHIEALVTEKTKAIIPVHLFGQCADMDAILELSDRYGLGVIEDAAQAIGTEYGDGRRAGSIGTLGCFSFFPSKNLGALGDGGMVVTNDLKLAEEVRILRTHGARPKYYHKVVGGNFRLDALQASVLNVKLNYLDGWTRRRQENAQRYFHLFNENDFAAKVGIHPPQTIHVDNNLDHAHIYNQFIIRVPNRDRLQDFLKQRGIATAVYYPVPFHLQECFQFLGYREGDMPEAERAANETLGLPIYPELTEEQQRIVIEAIQEFYLA